MIYYVYAIVSFRLNTWIQSARLWTGENLYERKKINQTIAWEILVGEIDLCVGFGCAQVLFTVENPWYLKHWERNVPY